MGLVDKRKVITLLKGQCIFIIYGLEAMQVHMIFIACEIITKCTFTRIYET